MAKRATRTVTRLEIGWKIAKALNEFGYPDVTGEMVKKILDAWIAGKRGGDLPHGVIGMLAGRQFDELEEARPGTLAMLPE